VSYPEYETDVLRTLSLQFNLQTNSEDGSSPTSADLAEALQKAIDIGQQIDQLKRAIFYGSHFNGPKSQQDNVPFQVGEDSPEASHPSPAMLHSALGLFTEAAEFIEAIVASMFGGEDFDRTNAVEELGDLEWYMAVMRNRLGISQEKVQRINIAKLRARYPDKFQSGDALERDHEHERSVLESASE
jgi:hypothetical protein